MRQLFHFSKTGQIDIFTPRPPLVLPKRPPGREWLNDPLVWAIDDWHQPMYLFPRDCPRILVWPTGRTTAEDRARHWDAGAARMIAFIEDRWRAALRSEGIWRYDLPASDFECLGDAGMWVSRTAVRPLGKELITDLLATLAAHDVELRTMPSLAGLKYLWGTSLHASGIRLRNAQGWGG